MSGFFGAGLSYAGFSDAGYGDIVPSGIPSPNIFRDKEGPGRLTGRRIDPLTRDYEIDVNANIYGMTSAQQNVEIAIITSLNTSAIRGLGQDLRSIKVISSNFVTEVRATLQAALQSLVDVGMISIVSIDVQRIGKNAASIILRWRDLTTGQEQIRVI